MKFIPTRFLALSDIHNNIRAVKKLRSQEKNDYDAILVAGDMGSETIEEFFKIMLSFKCPIYYALGNWDNRIDYNKKFSDSISHVHHHLFPQNGYLISGVSGCQIHWGKNPIALEVYSKINNIFKNTLDEIDTIKKELNIYNNNLDKEYDQKIEEVNSTAKDRRKKEYKNKIKRLLNQKKKKREKAHKLLHKLWNSKDYKSYCEKMIKARKDIASLNISQSKNIFTNNKVDYSKLIFLCHERYYKLNDVFGQPILLHINGHRHTYKHNFYKGTNYLNTSALDNTISVIPQDMFKIKDDPEYAWEILDNSLMVNNGCYSVISFVDEIIDVCQKHLI